MRGKTLGIVGYGNIGSQLSTLAEAHGHARHLLRPHRQAAATATPSRCDSLAELLAQSDVVTLHVPETPATQA